MLYSFRKSFAMRLLILLFLLLPLALRSETLMRPGTASVKPPKEKPYLADLRARALRGQAKAQFDLGVAYHFGQGVPQDEVEAVKWYRKAAVQGYDKAQYNLV
jgi:TPR repeat protein